MSRRQKAPVRPRTREEYRQLAHLARTQSAPAAQVAHLPDGANHWITCVSTLAKALLAVAAGQPYQDAARAAGRRSGDAVAQLVARFNHTGLAAVPPRHGGGPTPR